MLMVTLTYLLLTYMKKRNKLVAIILLLSILVTTVGFAIIGIIT